MRTRVLVGLFLFTLAGSMHAWAGNAAKVDVCHLISSATTPYNVVSVAESAVQAHLNHGDVLASEWFTDTDSDGEGAGSLAAWCEQPGLVQNDTDCDDTDAALNTADGDGDGYSTCDDDCDDEDDANFPGNVEVCDEQDNDCDEAIDDNDGDLDTATATTWYADLDGDGHGDANDTALMCEAPTDYVDVGGDCDDSSALASPDITEETCGDGLDNDCDGLVDDEDTDTCGVALACDCDTYTACLWTDDTATTLESSLSSSQGTLSSTTDGAYVEVCSGLHFYMTVDLEGAGTVIGEGSDSTKLRAVTIEGSDAQVSGVNLYKGLFLTGDESGTATVDGVEVRSGPTKPGGIDVTGFDNVKFTDVLATRSVDTAVTLHNNHNITVSGLTAHGHSGLVVSSRIGTTVTTVGDYLFEGVTASATRYTAVGVSTADRVSSLRFDGLVASGPNFPVRLLGVWSQSAPAEFENASISSTTGAGYSAIEDVYVAWDYELTDVSAYSLRYGTRYRPGGFVVNRLGTNYTGTCSASTKSCTP
jgi:hypothetical protein